MICLLTAQHKIFPIETLRSFLTTKAFEAKAYLNFDFITDWIRFLDMLEPHLPPSAIGEYTLNTYRIRLSAKLLELLQLVLQHIQYLRELEGAEICILKNPHNRYIYRSMPQRLLSLCKNTLPLELLLPRDKTVVLRDMTQQTPEEKASYAENVQQAFGQFLVESLEEQVGANSFTLEGVYPNLRDLKQTTPRQQIENELCKQEVRWVLTCLLLSVVGEV